MLLVMDYTPNGSLYVKAHRPKLPCPAAACVPMSQPLPTLPSPAHPSRRQALRMVPSPPRPGPTTLGTGDHWFFPSLGCGLLRANYPEEYPYSSLCKTSAQEHRQPSPEPCLSELSFPPLPWAQTRGAGPPGRRACFPILESPLNPLIF